MKENGRKGGLGRGLDSLFSNSSLNNRFSENKLSEEIIFLEISEIVPNGKQPRYCFNEESIESLSNSIKLNGLLQPIVVRKVNNNKFEIVVGERRFRASKMAGLKKIPVIIKEINDEKSTLMALIENLQRENLNPVEEAKGFLNLIKLYNLTQDEVAKEVGRSRSAVANSIRLLSLPSEILEYVENSVLTEGHARALLSISDLNLMKSLALKSIESKLSVRELEKLCSQTKQNKKSKRIKKLTSTDNSRYKELEESIKAEIKRNVKIEMTSGEKGKLVIDFYNHEDLISMAYTLANVKRF